MFRLLVLVHRYLGIAVGLVVALWCLSGFVMMYVQYPDLTDPEYLAGLPELDLDGCCIANPEVLDQLDGVDEFSVEMLAGRPVLRARYGRDISILVNLATGWWFSSISQETALQQADAFLDASGIEGEARFIARQARDQWTVAGYFNAHRPLFLVAADDPAGTELYISGVTGQIVQSTTANERFWNRLGAVIHWIYPTELRRDTALWAQVVIWLTIVSLFLVVVGLYLGIRRLGRGRNQLAAGSRSYGRGLVAFSPYRGVNLWHHYSGLLFGLVTLTWLASGLLSMNPWGALKGAGAGTERARLVGGTVSAGQLTATVNALGPDALPAGTVRLRSTPLDGMPAFTVATGTGARTRLDSASLKPAPLNQADWSRIAALTGDGRPVREAGLIASGDHYYFSHHDEVSLPAYRIVFDDAERSRYYFDPVSGDLRQKFDRDRRWNRWLFHGLHRFDFTPAMRERPLWDVLVLGLMLGVTVASLSGVLLAWRRITRKSRST